MKKVIFASHNAGKILELNPSFQEISLDLVPQSLFGVADVPETGLTFVENALIKARHACQQTGLPAMADDSGLQVDALQGAPGILSARFAGEQATAQENIQKLLMELKNVPAEKRTARFYCVLVYLKNAKDTTPLIAEGSWEGSILTEPLGKNGFGYDPVFWVSKEQQTAAQLSPARKNQISHRGQAVRGLKSKFIKFAGR
jgi:XTP/dITP diphosphohydrolase